MHKKKKTYTSSYEFPKPIKEYEVAKEEESGFFSGLNSRKKSARFAPSPKKWSKNKFKPLLKVHDPEPEEILLGEAVKSDSPLDAQGKDKAFPEKDFVNDSFGFNREAPILVSYVATIKQNTRASPPLTHNKNKNKKKFSHSFEGDINRNR